MWLLKLHIAFSVLCLLTFYGFLKISRDTIKRNGYGEENKKKKSSLSIAWVFFVPFLNVMALISLLIMIGTKKEELDKWKAEQEKER